MPDDLTIEIIRAAPAALWVLFALFVYLSLRTVIKAQLKRLSAISGPGGVRVEFEKLLEEQQARDAAASKGDDDTGPQPTANERRGTVARLEHAAEYLNGGRILWVDDHPEWSEPIATLFRRTGMTVDEVRSTRDAIERLRTQSFDLIITDMSRDTEEAAHKAGAVLIDTLARMGVAIPVILFSRHIDTTRGLPKGLFAYTTSGDNVVQSVVDVMERVRFGISTRTPARRRS
jgi:CheY-like chemotaxis protein